jgi:hypothetical protein
MFTKEYPAGQLSRMYFPDDAPRVQEPIMFSLTGIHENVMAS